MDGAPLWAFFLAGVAGGMLVIGPLALLLWQDEIFRALDRVAGWCQAVVRRLRR